MSKDPIETTSLEEKKQLPLEAVTTVTETVEKVESKGAVEPPKGVEEKKVETPTVRTYSQADWDKRQSAIDKQLNKGKTTLEEVQTKYEDILARSEERQVADWLKSVETGGGDMTQANQVAEAQRAQSKQKRELEKQQATVSGQLALVNEAEKVSKARKLVETHSLGDDAVEGLLEAQSPEEMEIKALTLRVEKIATDQTPVAKVGSPVSSLKGVDTSKMSLDEQLGVVIEEIESRQNKG